MDNSYQSVMDVVVRANENEFREMKQMCEALLELMEDELKESREQGISIGRQEEKIAIVTKMVEKGLSAEQIARKWSGTYRVA